MATLTSHLHALRATAARKRLIQTNLDKASTVHKTLQNAVKLANGGIAVMLESLWVAEESLQSLSEIRIQTEALVARSRRHSGVVDMRRKLAELSFEAVNARKKHETAVEDAWKGWRDAMKHTANAGKAHSEAKETLNAAMRVILHSLFVGDSRAGLDELVSTMRAEYKDMNGELELEIDAGKETLRGTLKRIGDHKKAWEWVDEEVKKAAADARKAITGA